LLTSDPPTSSSAPTPRPGPTASHRACASAF